MLKSPLLPIFLIVSVDVLGLTIILPLLPFYAEHYGASPAVVGLLVSLYALCQLIAGPILGRLSDHMGRRPLLLVSQVGTFIGFLILAYANSLWLIFLSRAIDGITAGNLSLAQAYISDVTKPEDRAKSFALIGIAFGMGFLIGPGLSGFLAKFGYQYPIFVAAGLSATSILATYFLLPAVTPPAADNATPRKFTSVGLGQLRALFSRAGPGAAAVAILRFRIRLLDVHDRVSAVRRTPLYVARRSRSGRNRSAMFMRFWDCSGVILQGGLIGRLVKAFGETNLARAGFFCGFVGLGGAGVHALDSAAAGHGGSGVVGNGDHSPDGDQHDHAEGGAVGTRRDSRA